MKSLRWAVLSAVLMAVCYFVTESAVRNYMCQATVQVCTVPSSPKWVAIDGVYPEDSLSIDVLLDGPYVYLDTDGMIRVACLVPFDCTERHLSESGKGLRHRAIVWNHSMLDRMSVLTKHGMLRVNGKYYVVDYMEQMDASISAFWDQCGVNADSVELAGVLLDITVQNETEPDTWFSKIVCEVLCILTWFCDLKVAMVVLAVIVSALICCVAGCCFLAIKGVKKWRKYSG